VCLEAVQKFRKEEPAINQCPPKRECQYGLPRSTNKDQSSMARGQEGKKAIRRGRLNEREKKRKPQDCRSRKKKREKKSPGQ